jgi:hypothetical protein
MLIMEVVKTIASQEAEIIARNDSSTQTDATTTVNVDTQTAPYDVTLTSLSSPPSILGQHPSATSSLPSMSPTLLSRTIHCPT